MIDEKESSDGLTDKERAEVDALVSLTKLYVEELEEERKEQKRFFSLLFILMVFVGIIGIIIAFININSDIFTEFLRIG